MLDKVLSNTELLSYNVLISCLNSKKITDTQIKNIFKKYSVSITNTEENDYLIALATYAITCKNISEDSALDIINFMGGSAADDRILRALVKCHPDFQKSISKFCLDDNFFYNNEYFILCLNKENFEYVWYKFIKDIQNGVIIDSQKKVLCLSFASSKHITDNFVIDLIFFVLKDENYCSILKKLIRALLKNEKLSKESIKFLWKVYASKYSAEYNRIKLLHQYNNVVDAFKKHPNSPKELLDYLS